MPDRQRRVDRRFGRGALGAAGLLAVLTLLTAFPSSVWWFWPVRIGVVVVTIAAAVLVYERDERREGAKRSLSEELDAERERSLATVNGALQVSAELVQDLAAIDPGKRPEAAGEARDALISNALDLIKCDSPRVCYFRLDEGVTPRRMHPTLTKVRGRTDLPTSVFTEGENVDQGVWALIDSGDADFVHDIDVDGPSDFDRRAERIYKTYISVGVRAGSRPFGMLTVNALKPGELADVDVASMRLIARLLGTVEALRSGLDA